MAEYGDILVLGLGKSGEAAARYCAGLVGTLVDSVTVMDAADNAVLHERAEELAGDGITVILGVTEVVGNYGLCIASPGIPPASPLMRSAVASCDRVVSEIEFAYERSSSPWVAVTGTNGKTTTTALIAHLLRCAGVSSRAVGNIGTPAIAAVSDSGESEVLVAEVSSFQLALTRRFHPRVAVLLNITPDHVDWHGSLAAYAADKARVFEQLGPDDTAVIDVDDPGSAPYADIVAARGVHVVRVSQDAVYADGATVRDGVLMLESRGGQIRLIGVDQLKIQGPHNVSNALAAAAAVHALGVSAHDIQEGLRSFEAIEHRLEPVCDARGAEWFNDSKATNPDAVFKALASFGTRPLVLLLGGRNKGNDFSELARVSSQRCRAVVLFGEAADELEGAFSGLHGARVVRVAALRDAVDAAARLAVPGDAVVLSPACASFDEFANFEQRGRTFKQLVTALGECDPS